MNDDWRLQVDFPDPGQVGPLLDHLQAVELEHDLSTAYRDRVIVTRDDAQVFLYTGSREQGESAQRLVEKLAREHGWEVKAELRHWHPVREDWEEPDVPLPADAAAQERELQGRREMERGEEETSGQPQYEVRIDFPHRHEAVHFAERLEQEGLPAVHRWRFVLLGAESEADAEELAERIRNEAPPDSKIAVEGTWRAAYAERPPDPFAFLGGLGG